MSSSSPGPTRFVGIDVSKAQLDVAILPDGGSFRLANDPAGWAALIARLATGDPPCLVLEATGAYHLDLTLALVEAGMPPAVINPERTHAFIRSEGQRTKTDRTDARLLARFAQQKQPAPSPQLTRNARQLKELVACRDDFTTLLTMEKNRLHTATAATRGHHQVLIAHLTAERQAVDREIAALIASDPVLAERDRILRSMPGIGPVLAPGQQDGLPELGQLTSKELAALAGVAPHLQQSGGGPGTAHLQGGRVVVRKALYQMAHTAVHRAPVLIAHRTQLQQRMPYKPAVIACARRMLGILNAMVRTGLTWPETDVAQGRYLPQST